MDEKLRLVELSDAMEEAFLDLRREMVEGGKTTLAGPLWKPYERFGEHVERLKGFSEGRGLPEGWVPGTYYFLVNGRGRILGVTNLRHRLNDHLLKQGGHIGYFVRPSERRKGYATKMCAMALEKARKRGIHRMLITCDRDNAASARVIIKNGGVLENEVPMENGRMKQRYWVDLRHEPPDG